MLVPLPILILSGLSLVVAVVAGFLLGRFSQQGRIADQQRSVSELTAESKRLQDDARSSGELASANEAKAEAERTRAERLEAERQRLIIQKNEAETQSTKAQTELANE